MGNAPPGGVGGGIPADGNCMYDDGAVQTVDGTRRALPLPDANGEIRLADGTVIKTSNMMDMRGGADCTKPQQPHTPTEPARMNGSVSSQKPQAFANANNMMMMQGGMNTSQATGAMMMGGQNMMTQNIPSAAKGYQQSPSYPQSSIKTIQIPSAAVNQHSQMNTRSNMQQSQMPAQSLILTQQSQMPTQQMPIASDVFVQNQFGHGYTPYMPGVQGLTTPNMMSGAMGMPSYSSGMYQGSAGMSFLGAQPQFPMMPMQTGLPAQQYPGVATMPGMGAGASLPYQEFRVG
jgi:hypothetical protein